MADDMYVKTCPFCGKKHQQRLWVNIICPCGAKYYFTNGKWLQRKLKEGK